MRCVHYESGECSSCTFLDVAYPRQLKAKQDRARQILPDAEWLDPVASAETGFRNKAKLVAGGTIAHPTLGILDHRLNGVDLDQCLLYEPAIAAAHGPLKAFITATGLTPYSVPNKSGDLKSIIVTASPAGQLMVRFVLRDKAAIETITPHLDDLAAEIEMVSASVNILPQHVALPEGEENIHLWGDPLIDMSLGPLPLRLGPGGFFQTNTEIASALYASAGAWADELDPATVWDLYCGVGGFALSVASPGRHVTGVELSQAAVDAAATVPGVQFIAADVEAWAAGQSQPDLIIVNPPRRGIGSLADRLTEWGTQNLLYSSCNLESAARDLERAGMVAVRAQLFDMFPHTSHMETLILARRLG